MKNPVPRSHFPENVPDRQIVELFHQRNEKAIQLTAQKYGRLLYQVAYSILENADDVEECLNDTYLGLWNAIPPGNPSVLSTFAIKIIRRIAINRRQDKTAQKRIPSGMIVELESLYESEDISSTDADEFEAWQIGAVINRFVSELPEKQRYIFIGRFFVSQPIGEIAADLGISSSAVYKELDTMKKNLKQLLERNGITTV